MTRLSAYRIGVVALVLALNASGAGVATAATAPPVTRIGDTQLDPAALYFVSYDGLVNNGSFQQSGILTQNGYQYAAWYTADRSAVVARRELPSGAWAKAVLPHKLSVDDSHNTISLGISPSDGRLHVAMDTHNSAVFYLKSEAGLTSSPGSRDWSTARFGTVQRTLDGVDLGGMTYPRFIVAPDGRLQFSYRTGGSGNGTQELAEYSGSAWRKLGKWSSATGSWTSTNGVVSTTRNLYLHGLTYGPNGRLHAAFTWREGNAGVLCNPGGITNHDTGYVYSDDRGRTWRNSAGQTVGTTGSQLVSVSSPGHVVDPLDPNHALINQESQAVDSAGNPHVIISYVPGRFGQCVTDFTAQRRANGRSFHVARSADGTWRKTEIPVAPGAFGRSQIVFDARDNLYVVMPFGRIVSASKASGWSDWAEVAPPASNAFGEVLVDSSRVAQEGVLSVVYQEKSSGTTPSPLRVVDYRLG
jgi:putative BNR repeat neuraminidase